MSALVRQLIFQLNSVKSAYAGQLQKLLVLSCSDYERLCEAEKQHVEKCNNQTDYELRIISALLSGHEIQVQVQQYLGFRIDSFRENIDEFSECLAKTVLQFRNLLPSSIRDGSTADHQNVLKKLIKSNFKFEGARSFRSSLRSARTRLTIYTKQEKLKETVNWLIRLEKSMASLLRDGAITSKPAEPTSDALVECFQRIQTSAFYLCSELLRLFQGTCHKSHTARLILEDRQNIWKEEVSSFKISLVSVDTEDCQQVLHEGEVRIQAAQSGKARICLPDEVDYSEEIQDLCSHIQTRAQNGSVLLLAISGQGRLLSGIASDATTLAEMRGSIGAGDVTLRRILQEWSRLSPESKERLHRRDRVRIALQVASSFLQLNRTLWAPDCFHADGIRFKSWNTDDEANAFLEVDDVRKPFVSTSDSNDSPQPTGAHTVQCALTSLATILLQLYLRKPVDAWAAENIGPSASPSHIVTIESLNEHLNLARKWIEDARYDMDDGYADAVMSCLAEASLPFLTWDDANFHRRFLERVIQPPKEICKQQ